MTAPLARRAAALLLLLACSSCAGLGRRSIPEAYEPAEVPEALASAKQELEPGGHPGRALDRMLAARATEGADPALRQDVQRTLERAAEARLDELTEAGNRPKALREMLELDLPRNLSVRAGVEAARQFLDQGERMKCYRLIKKVDELYPFHAERTDSGELLVNAGLSLARDDGRYGLLFHYRDLAPEVLEYYTTRYPEHSRGPEAYLALAGIYSGRRNFLVAIEKHEDLILYYPQSPLVIESQAAIPHIRLLSLTSPEYDRSDLRLARGELQTWLASHAGHALEDEVRVDLTDCLRRLAKNDLAQARFYRRVDSPAGASYHARRAMLTAREGDDPELEEKARRLLAKVSEAPQGPAKAPIMDPAEDPADDPRADPLQDPLESGQ